MPEFLIYNVNIVSADKILSNRCLTVSNGKIKEISKSISNDKIKAIDGNGNYLCPGFIDLHIHGIHTYLIDNGIDQMRSICGILPQYGVTGFLPTVCPLPKGKDAAFLKSLVTSDLQGAQIFGFHLEGPFLTMTGALPPEAIGKADIDRVRNLIDAAKPYKAIFSIAPDFENIEKLLPIMAEDDTPVFMTHTRATAKQTKHAIDLGACHATHFYDVFPCPAETDPGVRPCGAVEGILADDRVSVDFILDGEHVDPIAVKMALKCKGFDKVCLITDANTGAGLPPGRYKALGSEVEFKYPGGPARMTENTSHPGCLAGSGLTMDKAVRNAVSMLGVDLPQAVRMATANPAKVLKMDNSKGQIEEGFDADLVLLDKELDVIETFIKGESCYKKNERK